MATGPSYHVINRETYKEGRSYRMDLACAPSMGCCRACTYRTRCSPLRDHGIRTLCCVPPPPTHAALAGRIHAGQLEQLIATHADIPTRQALMRQFRVLEEQGTLTYVARAWDCRGRRSRPREQPHSGADVW